MSAVDLITQQSAVPVAAAYLGQLAREWEATMPAVLIRSRFLALLYVLHDRADQVGHLRPRHGADVVQDLARGACLRTEDAVRYLAAAVAAGVVVHRAPGMLALVPSRPRLGGRRRPPHRPTDPRGPPPVKASRPTPPTASLEAAAPRTTGVGCAAPSASRTVRCAPTSTSPGTSACAAGDSSRAAATRGPEPYAALGLPRVWHDTGYRAGWLETAAKRHGVTDWHDVPPGHRAPGRTVRLDHPGRPGGGGRRPRPPGGGVRAGPRPSVRPCRREGRPPVTRPYGPRHDQALHLLSVRSLGDKGCEQGTTHQEEPMASAAQLAARPAVPRLPDGTYAVPDPHDPEVTTLWRVTGGGLHPWPLRQRWAPRPPAADPDIQPEERRAHRERWYAEVYWPWKAAVAEEIRRVPRTAADLFDRLVPEHARPRAVFAALLDGRPTREELDEAERQEERADRDHLRIVAVLAAAGLPYRHIARAFRVSTSTAWHWAQRGTALWHQENAPEAWRPLSPHSRPWTTSRPAQPLYGPHSAQHRPHRPRTLTRTLTRRSPRGHGPGSASTRRT
ncbi:putative DNA-binding protein (plasmid) [Streptomyces coelicolor A3(2)]|uniref:DNA-binding protein n=2 Tax=Streptomyces coelicolor TaxID=1902 RepID=Q8VWD8_STRCO|nr:putative DNA-binding protein [Streptomyces coelicolor A3(2)]